MRGEVGTIDDWNPPSQEATTKSKKRGKSEILSSDDMESTFGEERIWYYPDLEKSEEVNNLGEQHPATLYYLALVKDLPKLKSVFVEPLEDGRLKHWAVISERDYDVMDRIYDIEQSTIDRFPMANLSFRVTVSEDGPSVARGTTKVFDAR